MSECCLKPTVIVSTLPLANRPTKTKRHAIFTPFPSLDIHAVNLIFFERPRATVEGAVVAQTTEPCMMHVMHAFVPDWCVDQPCISIPARAGDKSVVFEGRVVSSEIRPVCPPASLSSGQRALAREIHSRFAPNDTPSLRLDVGLTFLLARARCVRFSLSRRHRPSKTQKTRPRHNK